MHAHPKWTTFKIQCCSCLQKHNFATICGMINLMLLAVKLECNGTDLLLKHPRLFWVTLFARVFLGQTSLPVFAARLTSVCVDSVSAVRQLFGHSLGEHFLDVWAILAIHQIITPLKEIWESPRAKHNLTSVGFEPATSGLDLPMLYQLSYDASTEADRDNRYSELRYIQLTFRNSTYLYKECCGISMLPHCIHWEKAKCFKDMHI